VEDFKLGTNNHHRETMCIDMRGTTSRSWLAEGQEVHIYVHRERDLGVPQTPLFCFTFIVNMYHFYCFTIYM
jgi:hypothetical protein